MFSEYNEDFYISVNLITDLNFANSKMISYYLYVLLVYLRADECLKMGKYLKTDRYSKNLFTSCFFLTC